MSNFFTRLSERHAVAPAIKPRAVSRFEVGAQGVPTITESEPPFSEAVATRLALDAPGEVRAPRRDVLRDATAAAPPRESAPVLRVTTSVERAPAIAAAIPETRGTQVSTRPVRLASEAPRSRETAASVDSAPVLPSRRDKVLTDNVRESLSHASAVVPRSAAPPLSVAVASSVIAARRDDVHREPDVIRVHIGRVEVRAIMPPARPLPRTSTPSHNARPMSLDQYLGGKERGRA